MDTYNDYDGTNPQATIDAAAAILAPIYQANGWRWATASAPDGIPTEKEIVECISSLFDGVTGSVVRSSTGRVVVEADRFGEPGSRIEKNIYLELGTVYGPDTHPLEDSRGPDVEKAIDLAVRFGGIDGDHHKAWVIDQMVRALTGGRYEQVVADACDGEDGPNSYYWDEGIAP